MSKPTVATLKSFIRRNRETLLIKVRSEFDGMIDGQQWHQGAQFQPVVPAANVHEKHNLGISGVWLVGHSRDYLTPFDTDGLKGFHVYNCCGSFDVAVKA